MGHIDSAAVMTAVAPDLPIYCAPCFEDDRWSQAVAIVGGDSICADHLDGYCARADLELERQDMTHGSPDV